jgi:GTP:adenosylcobinamide-phosphate guanylyltransferase
MRKLSLIFPMAGEGARFGYRFKPFLDINGKTFIEAAFEPFRSWLPQIGRVSFVFTRAQENAHGVSARLAALFDGLPQHSVILDAPTPGPAETLRQCLEQTAISGPALVCDCDHAVDVDGLMRTAATRPEVACAVPTWSLAGESLTAWSVAAVDDAGRIVAIREKALPEHGKTFRGVIGCYYFADIAQVSRTIAENRWIYLSDIVAHVIASGAPALSIPVQQASFFGDPARLARLTAAE